MIKQFKYYIILSNDNNYIWHGLYGNLYKKMMIEHYVFIISIMNYVLTKKDFEGEEHLIAMLQHLFTKELIE
jgi:meiotically up-regulated gene 157 (Mug157) protein